MIEKTGNSAPSTIANAFRKLSIEVSLYGFSFCVLDVRASKIVDFEKVFFKDPSTPALLLSALKTTLAQREVLEGDFARVTVIHKNHLFSLVPQPLFSKAELPNYLKFNARILENDHVVYDEIPGQHLVNVYVPYTNVNNYIFDRFGAFEFTHSSTVFLNALLKQSSTVSAPVCYVQVSENIMAMGVVLENKLLFYNQFESKTPEDFLYYLLFSLEQLQLSLEKLRVTLFGVIDEEDELYCVCRNYLKNVSIFVPHTAFSFMEGVDYQGIDATLLTVL